MMSLPKEMKYVESFVSTAKKSEYKDFSEEVVKILSDKIRIVMNKFLTTQRGPGESMLKYFNRIVQMYKNSNVLVGTDWEMDSGLVTAVYKIMRNQMLNFLLIIIYLNRQIYLLFLVNFMTHTI